MITKNGEEEEHNMQVFHEDVCNYRPIATKRECRHTIARMIIKGFQQSGSLKDKLRSGRPRLSTPRDDRILLCLC